MKKILFFAAMVGVAFTSCMNEEFIGDNSPTTSQGTPGAISFKYDLAKATRAVATGSTAAGHLGNQFIVYGEKNETAAAPSAGNYVFPNYQVNYVTSSAMTTTSNTEGWEYVGYTHSDNYKNYIKTCANPTDDTPTLVSALSPAQTIKYWDWGASSYTFTAVSASKLTDSKTDIENGYVTIQKNTSGTTVYDKGYKVTLTANADLDHLFFSERVYITDKDNTIRTADNKYGGNVTFRFHSMSSKVRVAMYETIPGYSVTINSFKVTNAADPAFSAMETPEEGAFKANFVNNAKGTAGSMIVKYVASGATQNHPTVSFTPTSGAANILTLGDGLKKDVTLGTTIAGATYDRADGADDDTAPDYTSVFPKEDNTQNLKLKVCYTLTAVDNSGNATTGETITVTDATAEIPAEYLRWKPGYAYTYIFKISDNSNGSTGTPGTNPAGLYPITFDAVEKLAEDGKAEFITTVSEPSITTFGTVTAAGKTTYVTGGNEYVAGSDVYVTIMDRDVVANPVLGTNVNVYQASVASADATAFPITEASVAESLAETSVGTKKITTTLINTDGTTNFTSAPAVATTVPKEDGTSISSIKCVLTAEPWDWKASASNVYYSDAACGTQVTSAYANGTYYKKEFALKLSGVKYTTTSSVETAIVVEYISYNVVSLSGGDDLNGYYSESDGVYTKQTSGTYTSGTYYKQIKTYKVIKVASAS